MSMVPALHRECAYAARYRPTPLPPPGRLRFGRPAAAHEPVVAGDPVELEDGRQLTLRPITTGDVAAIQRLFTRLSPEEVRMRFMHVMHSLPSATARRLCSTDERLETALVLMDERVAPAEMRGIGRIYVDEATDSAEFAVLVERAWTGRGLGALLMQCLVEASRRRGLAELWGYVLIENRPMLDLCRQRGFRHRAVANEPGTALITLDLASGA